MSLDHLIKFQKNNHSKIKQLIVSEIAQLI